MCDQDPNWIEEIFNCIIACVGYSMVPKHSAEPERGDSDPAASWVISGLILIDTTVDAKLNVT